jgi:hypothetical protein
MAASLLTVRAIRTVAVEVPMARPLGTSAQTMRTAPILLIDLETEEGISGWLIPRHAPGQEPYRRNILPGCSVGALISMRGIHVWYLHRDADTTKLPAGRLVHLGLRRHTTRQRRRWAPHTSAYGVRPSAAEYGMTPGGSLRSRTSVLQWRSGRFPT